MNRSFSKGAYMASNQNKNLSLFYILKILQMYSDENHRLSQKEIVDLLRRDFDMEVDRRTVKSRLMDLVDLGYEIESQETNRMTMNPKTGDREDSNITSNYYLIRDFSNPELRLLIDSLLFSKHLPYSQCKELVEKLETLSNKYFKSHMAYISTMPEDKTNNKQVFLNIDTLDEAIQAKKKVSFKYLEYGTDKKQHVKCKEDGTERIYVVSPYQMAAKEGKYYLICNYDKYDDVSNYRIDRIKDITILDEKIKPFKSLEWANKNDLNLAEYMKRHVYMYSSPDSAVKFRITKSMISDIIDMFGKDVRFSDETEETVCVSANVNEQSMIQFAKNYAPDVVILEPDSLKKRVRNELKRGFEEYK